MSNAPFACAYCWSAVMAQVASPEVSIGNALFVYGPMGAVLVWFMIRGEAVVKEIRFLSHRIDGLTKSMLVDVLSRENAGTQAREFAKEQLAKIAAREKKTESGSD